MNIYMYDRRTELNLGYVEINNESDLYEEWFQSIVDQVIEENDMERSDMILLKESGETMIVIEYDMTISEDEMKKIAEENGWIY